MENQLTLLHFNTSEDLLGGIDMLQQHHIIIQEVYSTEPVPGMEAKLNRRQLRRRKLILRFSCFGGMVVMSVFLFNAAGDKLEIGAAEHRLLID